MTLVLATGRTEDEAEEWLSAAHEEHGQDGRPDPAKELIEPDLPQYSGPKRAARRPSKRGSELRGHPTDE